MFNRDGRSKAKESRATVELYDQSLKHYDYDLDRNEVKNVLHDSAPEFTEEVWVGEHFGKPGIDETLEQEHGAKLYYNDPEYVEREKDISEEVTGKRMTFEEMDKDLNKWK